MKKTLGHCQCCGRQQAVLAKGKMSLHGYTVGHGWFHGVCSGKAFQPIEQDRSIADATVAEVLEECEQLVERAAMIRQGVIKPKLAFSGRRVADTERGWGFKDEMIPFEQAEPARQARMVEIEAHNCESRARAGRQFAEFLKRVADAQHGKALVEVAKPEAPEAIVRGEKRVFPNGKSATVERVEGGRVYWRDARGFGSWTGSRRWRGFPKEA